MLNIIDVHIGISQYYGWLTANFRRYILKLHNPEEVSELNPSFDETRWRLTVQVCSYSIFMDYDATYEDGLHQFIMYYSLVVYECTLSSIEVVICMESYGFF